MEQNSIDIQLKYQLKGHKGAVYSLAKGTEEYTVFSGGADRQIIEWDMITGDGKLVAHSSATVMSLFYIKEKNLLLIGQTEGGVHLIDLKKRKEIKLLKGHSSYIFDILYLPKKEEIVLTSADGSISVWSSNTFERLFHHSFTQKKLRKIDYLPEQELIAISGGDENIYLLNTSDFSLKKSLKNNAAVNVVRFSPDQKNLLVGDKMAHLHQIHWIEENFNQSLPAHNWAIYDIQYAPDQRLFATASRDKTVKIWDADRMEVLKRLEGRKMGGHTHSVNSLLWPFQETLISVGDDSDLRIWALKSSEKS